MNKNDEFVVYILDEAKFYRNHLLSCEVLPLFDGKMITLENVKDIITPFINEIKPRLHENLLRKFQVSLIDFSPIAFDRMLMNSQMHHGDETHLINQANADALLVLYLHFTFYLPDLRSDDLVC